MFVNWTFCQIPVTSGLSCRNAPSRAAEARLFRLAHPLKRSTDVPLKIRKEALAIGGSNRSPKNIPRGFERNGFCVFDMFGTNTFERQLHPLGIGGLWHCLPRFQAWMCEQNLLKVILRGAVIAVRPVALACLGLYELLVDLALCAPHMVGVDRRGRKGPSAAKRRGPIQILIQL